MFQADANEEAEMIIRAIMQVRWTFRFLDKMLKYWPLCCVLQDEVDKSVYSKMADDLEAAAKRMKKRKVKKVKENPSELTAWTL